MASVRFHIASRQPSIVFQSPEAGDFTNYQRTQVEIIKSQLVLDVALRQPEVSSLAMIQEQAAPVQWVAQQLQSEFPAPEILRLKLSGTNPGEIETLLAAITDAYLQEVVNKEKKQRMDQLSSLTTIRIGMQNELSQKKKAFRDRAKEAGSGDAAVLSFSHRLALDQLAQAKKDLLQFQSELRKLEIQLRIRERQGDEYRPATVAIRDSDIEERIKQDKEVSGLLAKRAELEKNLQKERLNRGLAEAHPKVKEYRFDLDSIKESLDARKKELRPSIVKQLLDQGRQTGPTNVSQLKEEIAVLKELVEQLLVETKRLGEETKVIKDSTLDLNDLREEIVYIDGITKTVASRAEAIRVELDAPTRVTILEKPTVSSLVDSKKQLLGTAGGAFGGLALAFVVVMGRDLRARRIFHPTQVSNALRIRVLGTLPVITNQVQSQGHMLAAASVLEKYPRDLLTESVDRTRLKLLHAGGEQSLRVLLITSAVSGEGKTSLATHLGVSLARAGRKTLLIDADLRRPALHKAFDLCLEPGFGAALRGEQPVCDVIRPTCVRGLEVIPAGRGDGPSIQALGQDCLGAIFEQLKELYDYILVDSAPVLAVVDAPLIARHVDGILFSVLCGVSHLPSLYRSYEEIASLGGRVLGAVVSGLGDADAGYGYYSPSTTTD